MRKSKKLLSLVVTFVFAFITIATTMPAQAATKIVLPKINLSGARTSYAFNSPIILSLTSKNYTRNVQYRVVLYNKDTKVSNDLYGGYVKKYFKASTPFQVKFTPPTPGNYSVEIYVKRAGYRGYYKYYDGFYSWNFTVSNNITYNTEGTYTGNGKTILGNINIAANNITYTNAVVKGNVTVTGDNATLDNLNITGTLTLDPGVKGSANVKNVTASKIIVKSGGDHSIHFISVNAGELVVSTDNGTENPVRIVSTGTTTVGTTTVTTNVVFDAETGSFGTIVVSKDADGTVNVELQGTFTKPILVEGAANITAAEGAVVPEIKVTAPATETVTLSGDFKAVEVSTPTNLVLASGSTVTTLEVKADAQVTVTSGAVVEELNTNGNNVAIGGSGTVEEKDGQPVNPPSGGGGSPTVYGNSTLNSELITYFNLLNGYSVMNTCATVNTGSLSTNGGLTNNITVTIQSKTGSTMYNDVKARIYAKTATLTGNDATYLTNANTLFGKISVDGSTLNNYIVGKISSESADTRAFFANMNATTYSAAFDDFGTNYDTYDKALAFLNLIFPGGNNITELKYNNTLTLSKVYANNSVTPFYDGTHKEISIGSVKSALGISTALKDANVKTAFSGKSLKFEFTDNTNTYTYVVNFN